MFYTSCAHHIAVSLHTAWPNCLRAMFVQEAQAAGQAEEEAKEKEDEHADLGDDDEPTEEAVSCLFCCASARSLIAFLPPKYVLKVLWHSQPSGHSAASHTAAGARAHAGHPCLSFDAELQPSATWWLLLTPTSLCPAEHPRGQGGGDHTCRLRHGRVRAPAHERADRTRLQIRCVLPSCCLAECLLIAAASSTRAHPWCGTRAGSQ